MLYRCGKVWKAGSEDATISYTAGYGLDGVADENLIKEAVTLAEKSEIVLVNVGISGKMAGEDRALAYPEFRLPRLPF